MLKRVSLATAILIASSSLYADCKTELARSIEMTERCLGTLDAMAARDLERDKVAQLQDALRKKDAEIAELKVRLADSDDSMLEQLKRKVSELSSRLRDAIAERDTAKKERDEALIQVSYWRKKAKLSDRYAELSGDEVIAENAYRIPVYLLNVRAEPTASAEQVAVYKKGDVVRIFDVVRKKISDGEIFWLKTRKGWIYVTDAKDEDIHAELMDYMQMVQSDKTSRLAKTPMGSHAKGGARS